MQACVHSAHFHQVMVQGLGVVDGQAVVQLQFVNVSIEYVIDIGVYLQEVCTVIVKLHEQRLFNHVSYILSDQQ